MCDLVGGQVVSEFQLFAQDGSGAFQIDSENLNLFLRAKGVARTTWRWNPSYLYSDTMQNGGTVRVSGVRGQIPLIAISSVQASACIPSSVSPGVWDLNFSANGDVGSLIEWWLFDVLGNDEASPGGLLIYNAQSQLVYDLLKKPLRIVDVVPPVNGFSKTYPAGRKYAAVYGGGGGSRSFAGTQIPGQPETPAGYAWFVGGCRVSGTTVSSSFYQATGGQGASFNADYPDYAIVADVSNY